jgi:hypothetical protein
MVAYLSLAHPQKSWRFALEPRLKISDCGALLENQNLQVCQALHIL